MGSSSSKTGETESPLSQFRKETLEKMVNGLVKRMPNKMSLDDQISLTHTALSGAIHDNAKTNNNRVTARIEVFELSGTFMNIATFFVDSREKAKLVAWQMMTLYGLLVENYGSVHFDQNKDSHYELAWLEPRIVGAFEEAIKTWFDESLSKGVISDS